MAPRFFKIVSVDIPEIFMSPMQTSAHIGRGKKKMKKGKGRKTKDKDKNGKRKNKEKEKEKKKDRKSGKRKFCDI